MENENKKKEIVLSENVTTDIKFENMIKSHLHQIKKDGILEEVRKKRYYIKPSEIKREKAKKLNRNK